MRAQVSAIGPYEGRPQHGVGLNCIKSNIVRFYDFLRFGATFRTLYVDVLRIIILLILNSNDLMKNKYTYGCRFIFVYNIMETGRDWFTIY